MRKLFTFLLALVASVGMMTTSLWAQSITVAVDTESQFVPTQIVNGDFSTRPFMQFKYNNTWYNTWSESNPDITPWSEIRPNGIGEGWNTTETMIYDGGVFEWTNEMNVYNPTLNTNGNNAGHDYFIEMNAVNGAVFYQDLATNGHDVIRWSLQHAVRTGYADPQSMRVEIGAPQRDGSNNIVAASGVNAAVDAKIIASTKATYTSSGYTGYNGCAGDYSGLSLALSQNAQWYTVTGVYSIPEGQDVTRFAFIATSTSNVGGGNLLDNLTFSTLIGNLSAQQLANNDVELKGYWGETDPSKKLKVVIDDVVHEVNMSSVVGNYFKITIPAAIVGTATSVETYHQDYQAAKISTAVEPKPEPEPAADALPGVFSVSADKAVCFSKGNLQYTKSTGKWKIMDHQYDVVETLNQNVGTDYASQDVVTLFGWGTSGWDNTAADATSVHYQPYSTCNTNHSTANNIYQYGPSLANVAASESWSKEVAGNHPYENYDWGVFNSGDLGAGWRTLTKDEWVYLFNTRTPGNSVNGVSNARYTEATINTDGTAVNGIILFPDDADMTSVSGVTWGTINSGSAWGTKCTTAGWTALETAGCVFLPAAGSGNGTSVNDVGSRGHYWSSSASSAEFAYGLYFYSGNVNPQFSYYRYLGCLVRLVTETAPASTPTDEQVPTNEDPENPSYHYSTFFHSTQNYKLTNDGTQAFIADLSNNDLVLTKIAEGEQVIPANTAVILRKSGSADPVVLTPTEENGVSVNPDENSLEGVDAITAVTSIDGLTRANCYVLSGQQGVGFYLINSDNLKAHKAYVKYVSTPGQNNAPKKMRFVFENEQNATGMESIQPSAVSSQKVLRDGQLIIIKNGVRYNVQGQIVK